MIAAKPFSHLVVVAKEVGDDVNNPDGGLPLDASNDMILETVFDIAKGWPHEIDAELSPSDLDDRQERILVDEFLKAVKI